MIVAVALLVGCAQGGVAHYKMETKLDKEGKPEAFNVDIYNTKNIGEVIASVILPDGTEILLQEKGVDASGPMAVMAESNKALVDSLLGGAIVP